MLHLALLPLKINVLEYEYSILACNDDVSYNLLQNALVYDLTTHPGLSKFIIKLIVTFSGVKLLVEGKNKQLLAPQ